MTLAKFPNRRAVIGERSRWAGTYFGAELDLSEGTLQVCDHVHTVERRAWECARRMVRQPKPTVVAARVVA